MDRLGSGRDTGQTALSGAGMIELTEDVEMGTPGYLACLLTSLVAAIALGGWKSGLGAGFSLALALLFYPSALYVLKRTAFWVFTAILVVTSALWAGAANTSPELVAFSWEGLEMGVQMALRTAAILIAMRGFADSVSPGELAGMLERIGLKGLGFTFGVAVNLLPALERSAANTWDTLRMRGGLKRDRLRSLKLGIVTVMAGALRRVDDIAVAAEVRGFSPERSRPLPVRRGRYDLPVAVVLVLVVVAMYLLW